MGHGNLFTAIATKSVLGPLCPARAGWPSAKAVLGGLSPGGVCGTPLPSLHSIMSPYLQPAWEASSCFPITPATDMCNWEQISTANAWLLKLTLGGRKHYISFWLLWLLLTAEVEKKPAETPLQMLAPLKTIYIQKIRQPQRNLSALGFMPIMEREQKHMEFIVSLQLHLLSVTKPHHLVFASASQTSFSIKPLGHLNGCIDSLLVFLFWMWLLLLLVSLCPLSSWVDGLMDGQVRIKCSSQLILRFLLKYIWLLLFLQFSLWKMMLA